MKKTLIVIGIIAAAIIILVGIYLSLASPTVDFRGRVVGIENSDGYTVFTLEGISSTKYIVLADERTNVSYCHAGDGEINLSEIICGNTIQGNYKKWFSKDNYAKNIEVQFD